VIRTWLDDKLCTTQYTWLVTGAAGFIGSHITEYLLVRHQRVVGLDNFSTGKHANLNEIRKTVGDTCWANFTLCEADIREAEACRQAVRNVDFVLHQAALGSVPLSLENPIYTNDVNVTGFLNILTAALHQGVKRLVYASSCAVYGANQNLPLLETAKLMPLTPYAASKMTNEIYAEAFQRSFGMESVGLRYFNVFGERQDPQGAYAAVIPRWITSSIHGEPIVINGDGEQTRDFVYVEDVAKANVAAALIENVSPGLVLNVAGGQEMSINKLSQLISTLVLKASKQPHEIRRIYRSERPGDIRHSHASVDRTREVLNWKAKTFTEGFERAFDWYLNSAINNNL
jgi:UDP-N-acetylglucosamine 4-epimerase